MGLNSLGFLFILNSPFSYSARYHNPVSTASLPSATVISGEYPHPVGHGANTCIYEVPLHSLAF